MATLEETLSQAEPLERVEWLVYSANWYEQEADRRARHSASSRMSAEEAQELADFRAFETVLRQQADVDLYREVNRGVVDSAGEVRWTQRPRVRRNAAQSNRKQDETEAAMAKDGRSAAIAKAMEREAPERPGDGKAHSSTVELANGLVGLRRSEYATGSRRDRIAANEAHAGLNTHLNRLARQEIARNERNRNRGTGGPLPEAATAGLGTTSRNLAADGRSGSAGTPTTTTHRKDDRERGHSLDPRQGQI
ncbi:MAG: hypothetical protein HOV68_31875 [Streptomycetaceae bacterium]|nr:hypothetical protein [Streptomycetaceae bacterium]